MHAVAATELEQQFGLESTLDVQVEFRLGQAADESGEFGIRLLAGGAGVGGIGHAVSSGRWVDANCTR